MRELSGDWFEEIPCEEIQADSRFFYDELVYFGDAVNDIFWDNELAYLLHASVYDRYTFDQHRLGFYYNSDPECAKQHELDPDQKHIMIFNGENALPVHVPITEETTIHTILYHINHSIVMGTPRWSQRSYECVFKYYENAIVFMMDEGSLYNVVNHKDDWRVALIAKITEWIQENDTNFVPVVAHWDIEEATLRVPSLAHILNIDKSDIPHLYMYHPYDNTVLPYPEKLDDSSKISPELVMMWAEIAVKEWVISDLTYQIDYTYTNEDGEEVPGLTDEMKEEFKQILNDEESKLDKLKKDFDEHREKLATDNHFHNNMDDHLEVAEAHMTRIEYAFLEEL